MNEPIPLFLDISSQLTGFSAAELEATGMASLYWDTVQRQNPPADVEGFLSCSRRILQEGGGDETAIHDMIAAQLFPTNQFGGLAQNLINLWYLGQWIPANQGIDLAAQHNVSSEAYVQSLVWRAAQTHPPGARQPGFGSWAEKPLNPN